MRFIQVLLALSILVFIHELGHFLFAKMFGIRVEKFYMFFDAGGFRLFSTRHNRFLNRLFPRLKDCETDYGIGWLPLGGYCKISGMVDESMDLEQLKKEPQPYEFRTHPAWQRLLVMFGGVLFNFILAVAIFIGMLSHNGTSYLPNEDSRIYPNALAREMGFHSGDHILLYDDYAPGKFNLLLPELARRSPDIVTVLRGGDTVRLYIDHSRMGEVLDSPDYFMLAMPFIVDSIPPSSLNYGSGIAKGDRICAINGTSAEFVQDARALLQENRGSLINAGILRGSDSLAVTMQVDSAGMLGIYLAPPDVRTERYSLAQAIPAGIKLAFTQTGGYLRDLRLVATPSTGAYKSVGSFIAVGQAFPKIWDWNIFLNMIAMLSIMLAVMNLIPIPGLDGGHIMIVLYEMVSGRKPSQKFLVVTQTIGMVLIMMLMFLAFGNDLTRLFK